VATPEAGTSCAACGHAPITRALPFCPACGEHWNAGTQDGAPRTSVFTAKRSDTGGAQLVLLDDGGKPASKHPLAGADTTIGRVDTDVAFPDDPFLSPVHAQVNVREGRYWLRDLGSRNGTWYFLEAPYRLQDGDLILVGSQVIRFRRLGYPGPNPPEADATRRLGSLIPSADIASLTQLRADGSARDTTHLSPGRVVKLGRERGDWVFPYDPSMSGAHCEVRSEDADFVLADDGSRNGVAVCVRGEVEVRNGSRLLVGDKMLRLETA
jgi:pSer/pThr/pTyr-binding forkhead associated (FHA) protein